MSFRRFAIVSVTLAVCLAAVSAANASVYAYLRSNVQAFGPWGVTTNETAMTQAFGAGNWDDLRFETTNVASLFSTAYKFVFLEGGDFNANELETFLNANTAAISSWVNAGGSLFVNAAPNEGNGMNFGFGVTLNYPAFAGASVATAVNPLHPIFAGPSVPTALNYTGGAFSHATVADGITFQPILVNGIGATVLGEMNVGAGHVLFGGMTTDNFHQPQPQAHNLRVNMLVYGAGLAGNDAVPEPMSLLVWGGLGVASAVALRRTNRKEAERLG